MSTGLGPSRPAASGGFGPPPDDLLAEAMRPYRSDSEIRPAPVRTIARARPLQRASQHAPQEVRRAQS